MSLTPAERSLRAKLAAHTLHKNVDSRVHTEAARAAFSARFGKEVDPTGLLDPKERARRAEQAKRAYFANLAFRSSKARRLRAEGGDAA
jgi:hypothetical protein